MSLLNESTGAFDVVRTPVDKASTDYDPLRHAAPL